MGLNKGTIVLLLLFVSSALSLQTSTSCGLVTRDIFEGTFTALGAVTPSTLEVVIGFATTTTEIVTPGIVYDSRWSYNGTHITASYVSSYPQSELCSNQGVYATSWTNNCGTVTLTLAADSCAERAARLNKIVLSQVPSQCVFQRLTWWRGIYPVSNNSLTSGLRVEMDLGTKTDVNETSSQGVVYTNWALDPTSRNLLRWDIGSTVSGLACVMGADQFALYNLVWSRNCTAIQFNYIANDCPAREAAYNGLYLTFERSNTPTCQFYSGDTWKGVYGGPSPYGGVQFQVSFEDLGQVVETSSIGNRQSVWSLNSLGDLTMKDVFSIPFNFSCGPTTGSYYLDWNADCSTAVLTPILDACTLRRQIFGSVTLQKEVSICKFLPFDTWSGIYPGMDQTRSGAVATLYFANQYIVNETFTTLSVPLGTVASRWQLTAGGSLDVRWLGANPSSSCTADDEALYQLVWSRECSTVQLHVVYDQCAGRQNIYDGFTISRVIPNCQLLQGDSYLGTFPASQIPVNVTVSGLNLVQMLSNVSSMLSTWTIDGFGNLMVSDLSGSCNGSGLYQLLWSPSCNSVQLFAVTDGCGSRFLNLNGLVLTLAGPGAYQCRTLPGSSWIGVYAGVGGVFSGRTVTFSFSSMINAYETSSAGTIVVTWSIMNNVLSVGEIPELSPDPTILCPSYCGKMLSLYNVSWSLDCTQITLTLVSDSCPRRSQTYNGIVLNRVNSGCQLYPSEEWRGVYPPQAGPVAGLPLKVDFSTTPNQLIESTTGISWSNCWLFNPNLQLLTNTFSSSPPQEDCDASVQGLYAPVFMDNCNTLNLWKIYDPCPTRSARYESLSLSRQISNGPACGFMASDVWEGNFSSDARLPFTSADVKIQFTTGTAVFETSSGQTKQANIFIDRNGLLNIRDTLSQYSPIYACDSGLVGQYDLVWSWDCARVDITANFDPCERRRNRMDGMWLKKSLSKCRLLQGAIFDAVVPAGKYVGQALNLTIGSNGAVQILLPTSTLNSRWTTDSNGYLQIVDAQSPQCADACDPGIRATYAAIYSNDCNQLTLNVINDPCLQRANLLDTLSLTKRYLTVGDQLEVIGYDTQTEVQFNFGGMIPPLPCCTSPKDPGCNSCSCGN